MGTCSVMESAEKDDNSSDSLEDMPGRARKGVAAPKQREKPEIGTGATNMSMTEPSDDNIGELGSAALASNTTLATLREGQAQIIKLLEEVLANLNKDAGLLSPLPCSVRLPASDDSPRRTLSSSIRSSSPRDSRRRRSTTEGLYWPSISDHSPLGLSLGLCEDASPYNCDQAPVDGQAPVNEPAADAAAADASAVDQPSPAGEQANAKGTQVNAPAAARPPPLNLSVVLGCTDSSVPYSQSSAPELPGFFLESDTVPAAGERSALRDSLCHSTPPECERSASQGTEDLSVRQRASSGMKGSRPCVYELSADYAEALFLQERRSHMEAGVRQARGQSKQAFGRLGTTRAAEEAQSWVARPSSVSGGSCLSHDVPPAASMGWLRAIADTDLLAEMMDRIRSGCSLSKSASPWVPALLLFSFGLSVSEQVGTPRIVHQHAVIWILIFTIVYSCWRIAVGEDDFLVSITTCIYAVGGLAGLLSLSAHPLRFLRRYKPERNVSKFALEQLAQGHNLLDCWRQLSIRQSVIIGLFWAFMVVGRLYPISSTLHSAADIAAVANFFLVSGLFAALGYYQVHKCLGLELMIDQFCIIFVHANGDLMPCMDLWNLSQATLRRTANDLEWSLLALESSVLPVLLLTGAQVLNTSSLTCLPCIQGILAALPSGAMVLYVFSRAAAVTDKCQHVPAFVNSWHSDDGSVDKMHHFVQYVVNSSAGFYVFRVRLTTFMVLKVTYFILALGFSLVTSIMLKKVQEESV
eukprot:NODE_1361_length_2505_cov_7.190496.p1 GENE.NODE_1361_length_2505_cov_7.190496~~NODE_1361_length_2505_cov_7.190496.p1  ORF type:complete len:753 (+),score=152.82 NODE_1361_length_2505_cov_7.190496:2-2260(+)